MITIRLYDHPFTPAAPRAFVARNLAEWLLEHYGSVPAVRLQIYAGEPSGDTEITDDVAAILRSDAPEYVVLQSPGGEMVVPILINMAIATAISVAMTLLFPPPSMPGNVNRTQQSPNNALASRENQVRLMQRVEDIYGTVRAVPSLMMPTYTKYHNHIEYEYGYYCVSRGYCFLQDIKDGDTLLANITGASAAVYHPFSSPNLGSPVQTIGDPIIDYIVTVRRAVEVDGITLKSENQVQLKDPDRYDFEVVNGRNRITQVDEKHPNMNAIFNVGDDVTVTMTPQIVRIDAGPLRQISANAAGNTFTAPSGTWEQYQTGVNLYVSGFTNPANNGTFTITGKTSTTLTISGGTLVDEPNSESASFESIGVNRTGFYTVWGVGDGFIELTTSNWNTPARNVLASVRYPQANHIGDWVTLPDKERTEVWVNIVAPQGMYKDDGGRAAASVDYRIDIERLNAVTLAPTGQVETVTGTISGAVSDERAVTVEHVTAWVGPARVRTYRTTQYEYWFNGVVVDEIKWDDLYAVTPMGARHFGNKTTVHTVTKATARATAVKTRQLNMIAGRMLPTFDGTSWSAVLYPSGQLEYGTLHGTDRMIDILAAVTTDPWIGRRDISELDLAQVWSVQQQLDAWSDHAGKFNYTLDSDTLSFEETVMMIANAAFCVAYRQNGKIRLAFDRAQPVSTALFTHRNKKPNAETITRTFAADGEYDGIEFVYNDDISRQPETIILPSDGSAVALKKIEIPGISSFTQAWYRANREYFKLRGQRVRIETEATTDARMLLPNTRVDIVDNTRMADVSGEVVGQAGLELTLSTSVGFITGESHSIVLMKRDGTLQGIPVTPGSAPNKVVLAYAPAEAIVTTEGQDGIRTIFSFAADIYRDALAWSVQEIGQSDGQYIKISAVNYSDSYYQMDTQPVPPRESIIT